VRRHASARARRRARRIDAEHVDVREHLRHTSIVATRSSRVVLVLVDAAVDAATVVVSR
jgi:hypothetical protein